MNVFQAYFESSNSSKVHPQSVQGAKRPPVASSGSIAGRNCSTAHQNPRSAQIPIAIKAQQQNSRRRESPFPLSNEIPDLKNQKGISALGMVASGGIALLSVVVLTGAAALLALAGCAVAFIVAHDFFKRASNMLEHSNSLTKVAASGFEVAVSAVDGWLAGEGFEASGYQKILEKQFEGAILKGLWVNLFKNTKF